MKKESPSERKCARVQWTLETAVSEAISQGTKGKKPNVRFSFASARKIGRRKARDVRSLPLPPELQNHLLRSACIASVSDFRASQRDRREHFLYSRISASCVRARARARSVHRVTRGCVRAEHIVGLIVVRRVAKESISKLRKAVSRVTNAERERRRRNVGSRSPRIGSTRRKSALRNFV